mmetsp:Transcript_1579/g.4679  ORF Transcript_1579/g.4679 Transcript_1579/m.4679 type:complete len:222 (+) Transcript_1579:163-828(+)
MASCHAAGMSRCSPEPVAPPRQPRGPEHELQVDHVIYDGHHVVGGVRKRLLPSWKAAKAPQSRLKQFEASRCRFQHLSPQQRAGVTHRRCRPVWCIYQEANIMMIAQGIHAYSEVGSGPGSQGTVLRCGTWRLTPGKHRGLGEDGREKAGGPLGCIGRGILSRSGGHLRVTRRQRRCAQELPLQQVGLGTHHRPSPVQGGFDCAALHRGCCCSRCRCNDNA